MGFVPDTLAIEHIAPAQGPADFMNSLAVDTGGFIAFNEDNLGQALGAIAAEGHNL